MAIKIVYYEETLDNWGKKDSTENPEKIHQALTRGEEWNDDMVFQDDTGQIYFIDDLLGKEIMVEGFDAFILTED